MSFRRGVNRLLVVVIIIWEVLCLLLLGNMRGEASTSLFVGLMLGGPVLVIVLVRALFWVVEGFKGSSLK